MEQQQLIRGGSTPTTVVAVPVHGVAPTQVRVDMRWGWRSGTFDECLPFLLQGRVSADQYASTIHGLNVTVRSSWWRTLMWTGIIGMWVCTLLLIFDAVTWDLNWIWVFYSLIIGWALLTIVGSIGTVIDTRRKVDRYLEEANATYNPMGLNFRVERYYRRWALVIDIMPQYAGATTHHHYNPTVSASSAYSGQQQHQPTGAVVMQPAYMYPNPEGLAASTQNGSFAPSPYSQAAYQQSYVYNGKTYEQV